MPRHLRVIGLVAVLAACAGGGGGEVAAGGEGGATAAPPAANDPVAVRAAIDAANKKGLDGFNAGVPDSMVANYTEDAIVMMPGMKAMRGRAEIASTLKQMFEQMDIRNFNMKTDDVMVDGDVAVETGSGTWEMGPKGKALAADTIKYLTIWRKQGDGSWKIVRDINNSDVAPKM